MRLIVTRPEEDAATLKTRLKILGHDVILSPLLVIAPIAGIAIPDEHYQLIALTSANGARALSRHPDLPKLRALPVLAVGPQSAEAARLAGFANVETAGGDAVGLARHLADCRDRDAGPILYVSGRDSASDFAGLLKAAGFDVRRVIAYEARAATTLSPRVHAGAEAVLLFSPRTARLWAGLVAAEALDANARGQVHVCISANTAAALPAAYPTRVAAQPTEAAMLDVIAGLTLPQR